MVWCAQLARPRLRNPHRDVVQQPTPHANFTPLHFHTHPRGNATKSIADNAAHLPRCKMVLAVALSCVAHRTDADKSVVDDTLVDAFERTLRGNAAAGHVPSKGFS